MSYTNRPKAENFFACGMSNHRLYIVWSNMVLRCYNSKRLDYKNYGGRGIKVCEEWRLLSNFIEDMYPTFQEGLQLNRINNDGNYEPTNCSWVTQSENIRNSRMKDKKSCSEPYISYRPRARDKVKPWALVLHFTSKEQAIAARDAALAAGDSNGI